MTALFIVILTDHLLKPGSRIPALTGLFISFVCLLIFGASGFLIPSMIGISAVLMALCPILAKERSQEHE